MDLYIYSDESGVFDRAHNDYYVYGGLIFCGKEEKDIYNRKYLAAERNIAKAYAPGLEIKASAIRNKHKLKLYNALKPCTKFCSIVSQSQVNTHIFNDKKSKQRYLDYVYKIALKEALLAMERDNKLKLSHVEKVIIFADEHTTATDGRYELREALLQEFKIGTFNMTFQTFYPPIMPDMVSVDLNMRNSQKTVLIRAADIVANRVFYYTKRGLSIPMQDNLYIKRFP